MHFSERRYARKMLDDEVCVQLRILGYFLLSEKNIKARKSAISCSARKSENSRGQNVSNKSHRWDD